MYTQFFIFTLTIYSLQANSFTRAKRQSTSTCGINQWSCFHSNSETAAYLNYLVNKYPRNAYVYSIGKSVQGADLLVLAIAGANPSQHVTLRPEVRYIANMHGDETVGHELLIRYAHELLTKYNSGDVDARNLLDFNRVHLMPTLNPDGYATTLHRSPKGGFCGGSSATRSNAAGFDLNRNFPSPFDDDNRKTQRETQAMIDWSNNLSFILEANYHGGAMVANYPYDGGIDANGKIITGTKQVSIADDDDMLRQIASVYAQNHGAKMRKRCGRDYFPMGITNGAAWYTIYGSMQDYDYDRRGVMAITLEISCCKHPSASELDDYWQQNEKAMTQFLLQANQGLRGQIFDSRTGEPINGVELLVEGRPRSKFIATNRGEYWRILPVGVYRVQAKKVGYKNTVKECTVMSNATYTYCNIVMQKGNNGNRPSPNIFNLFGNGRVPSGAIIEDLVNR